MGEQGNVPKTAAAAPLTDYDHLLDREAAFIERQPEPVDWIRQQILSEIEDANAVPPQRPIRPDRSWSSRRV